MANSIIRGAGALIVLAAIIGVIALNPLVGGWAGSFKANADWQAEGAAAAHERNFAVICPVYRDAGLIRRWVSPFMWKNSWCEDYIDRL
jgi:hypothetical protein